MKKRLLPLVLAVFVIPGMTSKAATQTADEVVEKHLTAMGGREALGKITTRKAAGTISIALPNGTISGPVELFNKAPNKSRAVMELDLSPMGMNQKMTLDQKFDGTTGWNLDSLQGDTQASGNQLDNMRNASFPNPLLNYKAQGLAVELLPNETIGVTFAIVLKITPKAGSVTKLFLDPQTYLPIRSSAIINSPQMGGDVEQISEASDYRKQDGVMVAFKNVNRAGPQTITITLTQVQHNVAIADSIFSK